MDALAPGVLLAQAVGRFGNWFNIELFGRPLDAPWALSVPLINRPNGYSQFETFHPTFLYEAICCTVLALLLIKFGERFRPGQLFALYVFGYCLARVGIETIRIDEAHYVFGLRLNVWVGILVAAGALGSFRRLGKASGEVLG
jgi:prolipoprotein diacylglyceryl transferase